MQPEEIRAMYRSTKGVDPSDWTIHQMNAYYHVVGGDSFEFNIAANNRWPAIYRELMAARAMREHAQCSTENCCPQGEAVAAYDAARKENDQ